MESYRKRAFLCLVLTFFIVFVCLCPNSSPCGILEKRDACLPHTQIANSTDALCATQFTQQTPFTRYLPSTPLIRFSCVCVIMYVFMCVCVCVCVCMCVCVWKGEAKKMCNSIYSTACLVPRLAPYLHRSLPLLLEIELPCPFPQAGLRPSSKRANLTVFGRNRTRACFC